ncbi:hypothetical protein ACI8B_20068 [Acinetobacter proteolyticus]|uniref:Uncharacterized protein n=1 Tax=Acinetobacter proteolyticus TaxID=1776741 RepID=A0A653K2I7_9GAMM|nr:hypothetical protein ACI8B_20068 [Acinetobacter proteolyticus]
MPILAAEKNSSTTSSDPLIAADDVSA